MVRGEGVPAEEQVRFPAVSMAVANVPGPQSVGLEAKAEDVEALPVRAPMKVVAVISWAPAFQLLERLLDPSAFRYETASPASVTVEQVRFPLAAIV